MHQKREGDAPKSGAQEKTETDLPNATVPRIPVAAHEPTIPGQWIMGTRESETRHFMLCPKNICRKPGGASIMAFKTT